MFTFNITCNCKKVLKEIKERLDRIIMTQAEMQAEFDKRFAALDVATNEIAADLQKLKDQIGSGNFDPTAVLATFDANIAKLEALGAAQ